MAFRSSAVTVPRFWPAGFAAIQALAGSRWAAFAVLSCTIVLLRLPFQLSVLDHWDSVQYALGLDTFDVSAHMPHPPGSPFYILLGRGLVRLTGSVRTSFFLISTGASIAAALALFLLTDRPFGRMAAWIAAVVLITEPPFWYYGAAGNSWTVLAALAAINGLCCWRMLAGAPRALPLAAVVLGLSSGFRLDVTVFMVPVWLWCAWRKGAPPRHILFGLITIGLGVAAWLIPVVAITPGGFSLWLKRYIELFAPEPASLDYQARALLRNTAVIWTYVIALLGPLAVAGIALSGGTWRRVVSRDAITFFAVWAIPSFLFLWALDTTEAGHNLLFTVALLPGLAAIVAHAPRPAQVKVGLVAAIVLAQAAVFVFIPPVSERLSAPMLNPTVTGYTSESLRQREQTITSALSYIRNTQDPATTVIATLYGETPYRFMMYYLPEYSVVRVGEPDNLVRVARNRSTLTVFKPPCVEARVTSIVWVSEALQRSDAVPRNAVRVLPTNDSPSLWRVYADDPSRETEPLPGLRRCGPDD